MSCPYCLGPLDTAGRCHNLDCGYMSAPHTLHGSIHLNRDQEIINKLDKVIELLEAIRNYTERAVI